MDQSISMSHLKIRTTRFLSIQEILMVLYLLKEQNNGSLTLAGMLQSNGTHTTLMVKLPDTLKQETTENSH